MNTLPPSKLPISRQLKTPMASSTLPETGPDNTPGETSAKWLRRAVWLFYPAIGLEILFVISPATFYFDSLYGLALNALDHYPATSWLPRFFLPARVDLAAGTVTNLETPPAHVPWGDIPTPLF